MRNILNHLVLILLFSFAVSNLASASGNSPMLLERGVLPESQLVGDSGPVLVLIPCASCRWRSFDEFMERNKDKYRMLAVTLPGYGGTLHPDLNLFNDTPVWRNNAVDAVVRRLEEITDENIVVVGHSYGATVGLQVAERLGDQVQSLIVLDSNIYTTMTRGLEKPDLLKQARKVKAEYMDPIIGDYDGWQSFNMPSIHTREERKLLYHGWFMATKPEVMMQYWWENLVEDTNPVIRNRSYPIYDIQAVRPWDRTPDETIRQHRENVKTVRGDQKYELTFVRYTSHFIMEDDPEILDRLVRLAVSGDKFPDFVEAGPQRQH